MQDMLLSAQKKSETNQKVCLARKIAFFRPHYFFFAFFLNCNTSPSLGCVPSSIKLSL